MRILLAFYVLAVVAVSLVPSPGMSFWHVDKIGHWLAYAGMACLAFATLDATPTRWIALAAGAALGAVLECVQSLVPGRDPSLVDGVVNVLGLGTGAMFFRSRGDRLVERVRAWWSRRGTA